MYGTFHGRGRAARRMHQKQRFWVYILSLLVLGSGTILYHSTPVDVRMDCVATSPVMTWSSKGCLETPVVSNSASILKINDRHRIKYQTIQGFGGAFTEAAALQFQRTKLVFVTFGASVSENVSEFATTSIGPLFRCAWNTLVPPADGITTFELL